MNQEILAALNSSTPDGLAPLGHMGVLVLVCLSSGLCIVWGCFNGFILLRTSSQPGQDVIRSRGSDAQKINNIIEMNNKINIGIRQYLKFNLIVWIIFTVTFFLIIAGALESFNTFYNSLAYVFGAINSIIIAVFVSVITGVSHSKVCNGTRESIYRGYQIAKNSSIFQGFFTSGWNLLAISLCLLLYQDQKQGKYTRQDVAQISESLIAYSFGNASIAVLARITSAIYAKSADIALPLMNQMQSRIPKDSRNPLIIAKAIGETLNKSVGNSLMMVTLLSTAITISTAAAGTNIVGTDQEGQITFDVSLENLYLASILVSFSLFFCFLFNMLANFLLPASKSDQIKFNYIIQLGTTFGFMLGFSSLACYLCLPAQFQIVQLGTDIKHPYYAYLCVILGMFCSLLVMFGEQIAITSQFFVNYILQSCHTGSATAIIYGLAFGYFFNCLPIPLLVLTGYFSHVWLGVFGVTLSAIGFLTLLPLYCMINSFYSITENASLIGYITQMSDDTTNSLVALNSTRKSYEPHLHVLFNGLLGLLGYSMILMFVIDSGIEKNGGQSHEKTRITNADIILGLFIGVVFPNFVTFNFVISIRKAARPICQVLKGQTEDMPGILQGNVQAESPPATKIHALASTIQLIGFLFSLMLPFLILGLLMGAQKVLGFITSLLICGIQFSLSAGTSGMIWTSVRSQIHLGTAYDAQMNIIRPDSETARASDVAAEIGYTMKDGIALIIPPFIIFVQLMSVVMGGLYVGMKE